MKVNTGLRIVKRGPKTYEVLWLTDGYSMASRIFSSAKKAYDFVDWMRQEENWLRSQLQKTG